MHIQEKLSMDFQGLLDNGPICIAAFGDSVTHGALGNGEMSYETVYWNRLRQKINALRDYIPVNVINAGIGGVTAAKSVSRMERDVLSHHPDLVILCFGLNDINGTCEEFTQALAAMFDACNAHGVQAVYMTPNMLNTYVTAETPPELRAYAEKTAAIQNDSTMDTFMQAARRTAKEKGIAVCDCYSAWKTLSLTQDTTALLANGINHPCAEMHGLFAQMLFDLLFPDAVSEENCETTLWRGA